MKKKTSLSILLLISLLILTACGGSAITTKSTLIEQSKEFKTSLKTQEKLLTRLSKELNSLDSTMQNLKKDSSIDPITRNLESRNNTISEIDKIVKKQAGLASNFDKTIKQNNKNFPNHELKQVTQSEDIIQMDYQNFGQYLKKAQDAEKSIDNLLADESYDSTDLDDNISSLNQYYGAMNQQLEIWQVNLARVKNSVQDLLNQLKS